MSEYAVKKPAYDLTVRDFFVNFKADTGKKLEALQLKMPVIKSIRVQPGENSKEIYASGVIYDTATLLSDIKVGLNVVALPAEFTDRALGSGGSGAVSYDVTKPHKEEFSCGYWAEKSDGSKVYYYHPRCKLTQGDEELKTSESGTLPDPNIGYTLMILPTDENVWRARYDTSKVDASKVPLTPEEFFALAPETVEEIMAIPGTEKAVTG